MNTDTGNIFLINEEPLAQNEVELKAKELAELFPIRDLGKRLDAWRALQEQRKLATESQAGTTPATK